MDPTIKEVESALKTGNVAPHIAVEYRTKLAGLYSFYSGQLEQVFAQKPQIWTEIRATVKSDNQADRMWEMNPNGVDENGFKLRIKSIEKMMSALKTIIDNANNERNNSNY